MQFLHDLQTTCVRKRRNHPMKKIWLVLALVLAVATGVYGTAVASANHGHGGKGHGPVHGTVTGTDTTASTVTLTRFHKCDSVTISVTTSTKIDVNHKAGTLADIQAGEVAVVKLAKDGSAKAIHARSAHAHNILHGTVTGTDTTANTLTLSLKKTCATVTVNVTSDTKIQVNDKKGTLSNIQSGDRALVKLNKDGTARWIKARAPKS